MPGPPNLQHPPGPRRYRYSQPVEQTVHKLIELIIIHWTWCIRDKAYHLPHLHDVVLRYRTDDPRLVGVPGKV